VSDLRAQVRDAMDDAGISQADAARALGASHKHVNQMLTGRAVLTLDWAERLAGLCGMTVVTTLARQPQPGEESGAPVDWEAIARQRERELRREGEARHRAEVEARRWRQRFSIALAEYTRVTERHSAVLDPDQPAKDTP
jgi:transcriptional regulator with XRE-family HTH domain